MTISHPREMPQYSMVESTFTLDPGTAVARHAKGAAGTISQIREPMWFAKFQTPPLYEGDRNRWQAWANTLRGGLNPFLAWDVSRREPQAYPAGVPEILAETWDGKGTVTSLATPGMIAAAGCPAGFQLKIGDRVGLVQSGRYGYYDVSEDVVANGSGAISVPIEPLVQGMFTTSATVVFRRPRLRMLMDHKSFSAPSTGDLMSVAFQAIQVL